MGAEAFAAAGVAHLVPPGLGQWIGVAGWWELQVDLAGQEPSAAETRPVTAAWRAGQVSAAGVVLLVCGLNLFAALGTQTVVSEF